MGEALTDHSDHGLREREDLLDHGADLLRGGAGLLRGGVGLLNDGDRRLSAGVRLLSAGGLLLMPPVYVRLCDSHNIQSRDRKGAGGLCP